MPKKKSVAGKKVALKRSSATAESGNSAPALNHIDSRLRRSNNSLLYSFVVFLISMIIYLSIPSSMGFLDSLFGFIMVVSGALVILFLVISIILYLIKKRR